MLLPLHFLKGHYIACKEKEREAMEAELRPTIAGTWTQMLERLSSTQRSLTALSASTPSNQEMASPSEAVSMCTSSVSNTIFSHTSGSLYPWTQASLFWSETDSFGPNLTPKISIGLYGLALWNLHVLPLCGSLCQLSRIWTEPQSNQLCGWLQSAHA